VLGAWLAFLVQTLVAIAARVGEVRLIDNTLISSSED